MKKIAQDITNSIDRLRSHVAEITSLSDMAAKSGSEVTYTTDSGYCHGDALMNIPKIAVQHADMGAGTKLKCHEHDEVEILVLYEGDLSISLPTHVAYLVPGRPFTIDPGTPHIAESLNGAKMIAITIPASAGYPNQLK